MVKETTKKGGAPKKRVKKMPPISNWNPVLVRLYEKATEFNIETQQKDVAKLLDATPHDFTGWMRGASMSQAKLDKIAKYLAKNQFSASDIVYIMFG